MLVKEENIASIDNDLIEIPKNMIIPFGIRENPIDELTNVIFPNMEDHICDSSYFLQVEQF